MINSMQQQQPMSPPQPMVRNSAMGSAMGQQQQQPKKMGFMGKLGGAMGSATGARGMGGMFGFGGGGGGGQQKPGIWNRLAQGGGGIGPSMGMKQKTGMIPPVQSGQPLGMTENWTQQQQQPMQPMNQGPMGNMAEQMAQVYGQSKMGPSQGFMAPMMGSQLGMADGSPMPQMPMNEPYEAPEEVPGMNDIRQKQMYPGMGGGIGPSQIPQHIRDSIRY